MKPLLRLAFGIGSFWELSAIAMPIFFPLAAHFGVDYSIITGAIISGAVFGNHSCFYSDAVILTSSAAQIKPFTGALAIIPYALISAVISAVIYLALGIVLY